MNTDFLKDKSVKLAKGTLKTGKIVLESGEDIVRKTSTHGTNMIVNYSPDWYDRLDDTASGSGKSIMGNSVMVGKNLLKVRRSLHNGIRRGGRAIRRYQYAKAHYYKQNQELINKQINLSEDKLIKISVDKKHYLKTNRLTVKQKKNHNRTSSQESKKINYRYSEKYTNKYQNIDKRISLLDRKIKKYSKKIRSDRGYSLKRSTKATFSNQSRKAISNIANNQDMSSKVVGKSALALWSIKKYRKTVAKAWLTTKAVVSSVFRGILAFITSVPAMITVVVSSIPVLIVVVIVISILALFGNDLEYSGRVLNFSENEIKLENAYKTALLPDEILAISQTLGWTTHHLEDYEVLVSLAFGEERGEKPTFDEMLDNVFDVYNPANYFSPSSPINEDAYSPHTYWYEGKEWYNKGIHKGTIKNSVWLNIYPKYKKATASQKKEMTTQKYINQQKQQAYDLLEKNGYNYIRSFITFDTETKLFKAPIIDVDIASSSSAVGYRSLEINGGIDNSFHHGNDIPAPKGTRLNSPNDAVVVYADGSQTIEGEKCGLWGTGNSVILRKDVFDARGEPAYLYMMYAHLDPYSVTVSLGEKVKAGEKIGEVGTTGYSTGYHLHFAVWLSNRKIEEIQPYHWNGAYPSVQSDQLNGERVTVDTNNSYSFYLDGLMFYDIQYRNSIFGR